MILRGYKFLKFNQILRIIKVHVYCMFKSIPNPSFLSKIKTDSVGLWFYRYLKTDGYLH